MLGAIFVLTILPIIIIGMSLVVYYLSRTRQKDQNNGNL